MPSLSRLSHQKRPATILVPIPRLPGQLTFPLTDWSHPSPFEALEIASPSRCVKGGVKSYHQGGAKVDHFGPLCGVG